MQPAGGRVRGRLAALAENVIYSFKGGATDVAAPVAGLISVGGKLYGTTAQG
jgi:hypothetical protein